MQYALLTEGGMDAPVDVHRLFSVSLFSDIDFCQR